MGVVRQRTGVDSDKALWALSTLAENQELHLVGNEELGNHFEQEELIILEGFEGHEIKVKRLVKKWLPLSRDDACLSEDIDS